MFFNDTELHAFKNETFFAVWIRREIKVRERWLKIVLITFYYFLPWNENCAVRRSDSERCEDDGRENEMNNKPFWYIHTGHLNTRTHQQKPTNKHATYTRDNTELRNRKKIPIKMTYEIRFNLIVGWKQKTISMHFCFKWFVFFVFLARLLMRATRRNGGGI